MYRAIDEYDATLHYRPAFVPAHNNLGRLLAAIGKTSQAIDHYRQAVEIEPHFVAAHTNLAIALFGQGETGEALAQFRTALALKPSVETYANLAGACGQLGRFDEAIPLAEKALELARANGQDRWPTRSRRGSTPIGSRPHVDLGGADTLARASYAQDRIYAGTGSSTRPFSVIRVSSP